MRRLCAMIALVLLASLLLPSCSSGLEVPVDTEPEKATEEKKTEDKKKEETDEEEAILQEYDPAEDDVINVLMIGNSFCYYYVEELYGIAKAADVNMKVCNVYYSGCTLKQHWTWWKQNESNYQYFETNEQGRRKFEDFNLKQCLVKENWDVISFQQGVLSANGDLEVAKSSYYKYLTDLMDYVKGQFPQSKFYWHQTWSYQVGYDRSGYKMESAAQQAEVAKWGREFAIAVCQDYPMIRIPCGDAWQYARQDARVGDVLCNRGNKSDNYHDGDEGGGQYLNACVWFETITGKSCIGNTWRPDSYELSELKITALQEAAHRAVTESRG